MEIQGKRRSEAAPAEERKARIGDLLVDRGLVSRAQLAEALLQQSVSGKRIGALLVELGALDERELASVLATQLDFPLADLRQLEPDPDALARLPETIARSAVAVPLRVIGDAVEIAVADPSDPHTRQVLSDAIGSELRILIAPASDIRRTVDRSYRALSDVERHIEAFERSESSRRSQVHTDEAAAELAPVVQVVNLVLTQALRDRASDVHIEPQDGRIRLRFRIDGALHDVLALPVGMGPALVSRIKIMAGMNIVERRRAQDGQFTLHVDERDLDVRVSTIATIWGEKVVMRLLNKSRTLLRLDDLGIRALDDGGYSKMIHSPFGMVVVAGPTGSGKTTTLYATLSEINDSERNIVTVEDPVEYVFPSINQIQINKAAGVTFADELKAILRQDPDVILVGEVRDVETARLAVQSALTGHFVLSSLHATDAAGALIRFLDMGIEPFLVASSVLAVVSQRLLRRICPHCRVRFTPPADELAFYEESGGPPKDPSDFWRGEGCTFCARTGYLERTGVFEILRLTAEAKKAVVGGGTHEDIRNVAMAQGMRPMRASAMQLVAQDVTTIREVIRAIYAL